MSGSPPLKRIKVEDEDDPHLGSRDVPIKIEGDYQPVNAEPLPVIAQIGSLHHVPSLSPPILDARKWEDPTLLETWFADDRSQLKGILQFLNRPDLSRSEVDSLVSQIPASSGWIRPIFSQFEALQNQKVFLVILFCPKKDRYIDLAIHKDSLFTEVFIDAVQQGIKEFCGSESIVLDYRKECRRTPDDQHCGFYNPCELYIHGVATAAELLIAKNLFNISIKHPLGFSADVARVGNFHSGLTILKETLGSTNLEPSTNIPFHPSRLATISPELAGSVLRDLIVSKLVHLPGNLGSPEQWFSAMMRRLVAHPATVQCFRVVIAVRTELSVLDFLENREPKLPLLTRVKCPNESEGCSMDFISNRYANHHAKYHCLFRPEDTDTRVKCPNKSEGCDQDFSSSTGANKHAKYHCLFRPEDIGTRVKCPNKSEGCDRDFASSTSANNHAKYHCLFRPEDTETRVKCPNKSEGCDQDFASSNGANHHAKYYCKFKPEDIDTRVKCPNKSEGCDQDFASSTGANNHGKYYCKFKPEDIETRVKCPNKSEGCDKDFPTSTVANNHGKYHCKFKPEDINTRVNCPNRSEGCNKDFANDWSASIHARNHCPFRLDENGARLFPEVLTEPRIKCPNEANGCKKTFKTNTTAFIHAQKSCERKPVLTAADSGTGKDSPNSLQVVAQEEREMGCDEMAHHQDIERFDQFAHAHPPVNYSLDPSLMDN